MASIKQQLANTRNGKKGGPKTKEGKSVVRLNAIKHGLLSQEVLLPGEDSKALSVLRQNLLDEYQPQGQVEGMLVDLVTTCYWRLIRLIRIETAALQPTIEKARLAAENEQNGPSIGWRKVYMDELWVNSRLLNLNRYHVSIERQFYKALNELNRYKAARQGIITPPPVDINVTVLPVE